jgi:hypothetical protein
MSGYKDSVVFNLNSTTANLYTFTNGILGTPVSLTMYSYTTALLLYENTLVYVTSATNYIYATRKSNSQNWSSLTSTSVTYTNIGSMSFEKNGFVTNGVDIVYADPGFSTNIGQLLWTRINYSGLLATSSFGNTSSVIATDGFINPNISGGTSPYTYTWIDNGTNSITDSTRTNIGIGVYQLTVTDSVSGSITISYTISTKLILNTYGTVTHPTTFGGTNGQITTTTYLYGTPNYSYVWSDAPSTILTTLVTKTGIGNGTYTLTTSDASGYSISTSYIVSDPFSRQSLLAPPTDASVADYFGQSVAIFGAFCLIGMPGADVSLA